MKAEGVREVPFHLLEKIADLFGCEAFLLFEDNVEADNEILATAFVSPMLKKGDLKEIAHFKDLVKFTLKWNGLEMAPNKFIIERQVAEFRAITD